MAGFRTVALDEFRNYGPANAQVGDRWIWRLANAAAGSTSEGLADLPIGRQRFWGIPFDIGPAQSIGKAAWVVLGGNEWSSLPSEAEVPVARKARYVLVCHFFDADPLTEVANELTEKLGAPVAEYVLKLAGGNSYSKTIRNRFEINPCRRPWGRQPFAAVEHREMLPYAVVGADRQGLTGIKDAPAASNYVITVIANPEPHRTIKSIVLRATGEWVVAVAAITLSDHAANPLRRSPLTMVRADASDGTAPLQASLDMGHVVRTSTISGRPSNNWEEQPDKGAGSPSAAAGGATLIEAYGGAAAKLTFANGSRRSSVFWGDLLDKGRTATDDGRVRLQVIHDRTTWVHGRVVDRQTGRDTAARVHFSGAHGEYIAPHGHQRDINTNWCEDVGGDLKLGGTSYAYVNGRFQIELPVGEVFVEVVKGFEYRPSRQRISVAPGQGELILKVDRWNNQAEKGYFSGDTHVHFLDPSTAVLEAEAEDVKVVNILSAKWGRLFTDTERFTGGLAPASNANTLVWVGSENRHHLLGHMSLIGLNSPVYPLSSGGPNEDYLGGSEEILMAEWADAAHAQGALVVTPHFPAPHCEIAADIALGKIDAAEIKYFVPRLKGHGIEAWYKYLNCGYRLPAVGGTDKMFNTIPVGGVRTYAYIGHDKAFTHENWRDGIRSGNTFTTSGPLIEFSVEGLPIGSTHNVPAGGGTLELQARAASSLPFTRLEIVANGRVIADGGTARSGLTAEVRVRHEVRESCWMAARCYGEVDLWHAWQNKVAAHTSPIYVTVGNKQVFSPSDAAYLLTLIEGGITYLNEIATYRDPAKRAKHVAIFEAGRAAIHEKMHRHGVGH